MATNPNPILAELDNLSPQAKTALQQAHQQVASSGPSANAAQSIASAMPAAPPPPAPLIPIAKPNTLPGLGPAPNTTPTPATPQYIGKPSAVPTLGPPSDKPLISMNPNLAPLQAEQARLTTGPTGKSGIDQIHSKWGRIPLQIADAIGGGLFPGIEQRLPGTEGHHDVLVRENARDIANVQGQEANETKNAEEQALGNEANARANALEHPVPPVDKNIGTTADVDGEVKQWNPETQRYDITVGKSPQKAETVHAPITDDQGNLWIQHPDGSVTPVMANGKQLKGKPAIEKTASPEQQYIDEYQKLHPGATIAQALHQYGIDTQRPQQGPIIMIPNPTGGYTATSVHPGQSVGPGAVTTSGMSSLNVPTSTTRTMAETAPKVLDLANRVSQLVDEQEKNLGPAKSRWNEFMSGKVGAPNPEFTKLRTDVGLLTTALMRMHVGARGGEQMMEHFQDLINASKQDPENLKAALGEIKAYAQAVQGEGKPNSGGGGSHNAGNPAVGTIEGGFRYKGGDPSKPSSWEAVK